MYKYLVYIDLLPSPYFGCGTCFKKQAEIHKFVHEVCYLMWFDTYWVLFCCYKAVSFYCPNMSYQHDLFGSRQNCYDNKNPQRTMIAKFPSTVTQLRTRLNIDVIEEEKYWATKPDSCHMRHPVKLILPKDMSLEFTLLERNIKIQCPVRQMGQHNCQKIIYERKIKL